MLEKLKKRFPLFNEKRRHYFFIFLFLRITLYGFIGSQGKKLYFRVQEIKYIE